VVGASHSPEILMKTFFSVLTAVLIGGFLLVALFAPQMIDGSTVGKIGFAAGLVLYFGLLMALVWVGLSIPRFVQYVRAWVNPTEFWQILERSSKFQKKQMVRDVDFYGNRGLDIFNACSRRFGADYGLGRERSQLAVQRIYPFLRPSDDDRERAEKSGDRAVCGSLQFQDLIFLFKSMGYREALNKSLICALLDAAVNRDAIKEEPRKAIVKACRILNLSYENCFMEWVKDQQKGLSAAR